MIGNWYNKKIMPRLLLWAMQQKPIGHIRKEIVPLVSGNVLEVGFGAGANLPFYSDSITSLVAIDVSEELREMAEQPLSEFTKPFNFVLGKAEAMPFESNSYDCILCTWTLCSMLDPVLALSEMRRVLRPNGHLIFAEHGLAPDKHIRACQRFFNPIWGKLAGGCQLIRAAPPLLTNAGFTIDSLDSSYLPGPKIMTYTHRGVASIS